MGAFVIGAAAIQCELTDKINLEAMDKIRSRSKKDNIVQRDFGALPEMIPEDEVIAFVKNHKGIIETLKPSFFEMTVSMAFDYFAKSIVDVSVIEVGLGGRLDSTNIITPILSVITNIGHDHMDLLWNTLGKIAVEKAGIIKKQVPVIISETGEIFTSRAAETGSEIKFADQTFSCILEEKSSTAGERNYLIKDKDNNVLFECITVLGGDYQSKNLAVVYQVFDSLKGILHFSDDNITAGISRVIINTGLAGRWQVLSRNPLTICDTDHNKDGLEYVLNRIGKIPKSELHMVVGFVNDKDLSSVLPLFPKDAVYYFTKASVPQALDENILMTKAAEHGLAGNTFPDVKSAMKVAAENASATDLILAEVLLLLLMPYSKQPDSHFSYHDVFSLLSLGSFGSG